MKELFGTLVLVGAVMLSGCTLFTPDEEGQDEVRQAMLETLRERRDAWQQQAVSDYMWSYTSVDTRETPVPREVVAVVRDGEVIEVEVDAGYAEPGPLESYLTVSRAFDLIQEALEDHADVVRVGYSDGSNHPPDVPVLIEVDYGARSSGDERYMELGSFEIAGDE